MLYEIKESPQTGFFQYVISVAADERTEGLYILAGPPDGIEIHHGRDGAFWRRISLAFHAGPKDRVMPCAGRIWLAADGKLLEIDKKGSASPSKNPPGPLPDRIGEILCDASERIIVTNAAGTEIRRYDKDGNQDLLIGRPQKTGAKQQPPKNQPPPPPFKLIRSIATDPLSRIFVFDSSCTVFPFDQKARPLPPLPESDFQDNPFPCDSPSIAIDTDRNIWFVNSMENSIDAYNSFGALVKRIYANTDFGPRFIQPSSIFIDSRNRLYVTDRASASIKAFDLNKK